MQENYRQIWEQIAGSIRGQVSPDTFQRWFAAVELVGTDEDHLVLRVPNNIYQLWIETNYLPLVQSAVARVLGATRQLRFVFQEGREPEDGALVGAAPGAGGRRAGAGAGGPGPARNPPLRGAGPGAGADGDDAGETDGAAAGLNGPPGLLRRAHGGNGVGAPHGQPEEGGFYVRAAAAAALVEEPLDAETPAAAVGASGMNPRNTFDTFVVGQNNQFAQAASKAVADAPAKTYNPLFLYGGVGLGKTHLMQAIGQSILAKKKGTKVIYLSSEKFTNEFIDAIQHSTLVKFRKRYRLADVLLIDDIQFLAGKERSQEEFFHTFNALFDGHKQIVLSSDRPPSEIANLEHRLVSRFEWGLTAELQPPDIETRLAILRKKAEAMHVRLRPEILDFLAQRIRTNVRRLEGALMRVASFASLSGRDLTQEAVEHLLKDVLQEEAKRTVTIDQIQRLVADHYDVRLADMTSKRRPANIAFPRQVAMYLARELTKASLTEIGDAFGGRDHGTVLHAHRLVKKRIKEEEHTRQVVIMLDGQLQR